MTDVAGGIGGHRTHTTTDSSTFAAIDCVDYRTTSSLCQYTNMRSIRGGVGESGDQPSLAGLSRAQQLDALRARVAAIPGKVGATAAAPMEDAPAGRPAARTDVIAVPDPLARLLPGGGLTRGSVVGCTSGYVLLGLLAAATAAGEWAAVLGNRRLGLLAYYELGGDLDRLAHIAEPGPDPLAIAAVLCDGLGVVAIDHRGTAPAARSRAVTARVRSHGAVLILTNPGWMRPDVVIQARPVRYSGLGRGHGRLKNIDIGIRVTGRGIPARTTRLTLSSAAPDQIRWHIQQEHGARPENPDWERTG